MNSKILVLGAGYIGQRIREAFDCNIWRERIVSFSSVQEAINKFKPGIIINCIGHSGRNVDDCERDLDKTLCSNAFVPVMLAEAAIRNKIKLIHISSGCIYRFDYKKDRPLAERKIPDFFSLFYSRSKIYSERALEILSDKFNILIIRIRIPLDNRPHPKNLLDKLIHYKKVIALANSVTYMPDFIRALRHLIRIDARGIYNVVNKGGLSYPDLMEIYRKYNPSFKYQVIDFKKLNIVRTNLLLSTKKLQQSGFTVRSTKEVLEECVEDYLKY
ncbi:MAG: sugar nucleotide-binding protein [Candidatus Omnitrophica bacterium]|nr:sugar nucleotide-binding protein [Candidatus Omnitrophota bacterium]